MLTSGPRSRLQRVAGGSGTSESRESALPLRQPRAQPTDLRAAENHRATVPPTRSSASASLARKAHPVVCALRLEQLLARHAGANASLGRASQVIEALFGLYAVHISRPSWPAIEADDVEQRAALLDPMQALGHSGLLSLTPAPAGSTAQPQPRSRSTASSGPGSRPSAPPGRMDPPPASSRRSTGQAT